MVRKLLGVRNVFWIAFENRVLNVDQNVPAGRVRISATAKERAHHMLNAASKNAPSENERFDEEFRPMSLH
jgi:hypothetical protein